MWVSADFYFRKGEWAIGASGSHLVVSNKFLYSKHLRYLIATVKDEAQVKDHTRPDRNDLLRNLPYHEASVVAPRAETGRVRWGTAKP